LHRVVCWDRQEVAATIQTEAVSPSPAVFFATHTPLRIHRAGPDGVRSDPGVTVDEEEVARDFLSRPPANGVLLLPVIGESGTGKSHLVRWVKERTQSTGERHVIYLPKTGTSLKSLVTGLLAGRAEGPLAHLAAQVESMTSGLDRSALEQRLLNGLQEAMVAAEPTSRQMQRLTGRGRLETILLDPYVRDHLLQEDGLIPRLAASLLADRREGDGERPLEFTVGDLPLDVADFREAAGPTRKMLAHLRAEGPQQQAVALLNQSLREAQANAFNLGSGRLNLALLDIRRELAQEGKEIVLLIEDFALIQGVQRELLDAVIEPGVRDGRAEYAPIRTLLAVTTGYYRNLVDTVLTRAQAATPYVYDLDVQFDNSPTGLDEIEDFVGRYLNAGRLGRTVLDEAGVGSGATMPNACERCQLMEECHAGFGVSASGHGLFPFNRPALQRAILARAPEGKHNAFNPRAVIGQVIRNVLLSHASAITEGYFPDERFVEEYPTHSVELPMLPNMVSTAINQQSPADAPRRRAFLEFWGGAPGRVINLHSAVHTAFGLDPLPLGDEPQSVPGREPAPRPQPEPTPTRPPSADRKTIEIEEWSTRGRQLTASTARELRKIVRNAVVQRAQWLEPLMAEPVTKALDAAWRAWSTTVSIQDAEAENLPGTAYAPIKFLRTPENAMFLQGLLAVHSGTSGGQGAAARRLADIADRYRPNMVRSVQEHAETTDEHLVVALRASLLGAALAGRVWPGMDEADLLAAVVDEGGTWTRGDSEFRIPPWQETWEKHRRNRAALVRNIRRGIGVARGAGAVRMIDAARALPLVRSAADEPWTWTVRSDAPAWVQSAIEGFGRWDALVDEQFRQLEGNAAAIRRVMPAGTRGDALVTRLREAFDAAVPAGLIPGDVQAIDSSLTAAAGWAWDNLRGLHQDLDEARKVTSDKHRARTRTRAAVRDRGADFPRIANFLKDAEQWLDVALARAEQGPNETDGVEDAIGEAIRRWSEIQVPRP
jgi:hypothetical protein